MKHKTCDLEGWRLDQAVAMAEGWTWKSVGDWYEWVQEPGGRMVGRSDWPMALPDVPMPPSAWSRDWATGGQIIERERIILSPQAVERGPATLGHWVAVAGVAYGIEDRVRFDAARKYIGPTPLIAAMRAFVAAKLGEEVEL